MKLSLRGWKTLLRWDIRAQHRSPLLAGLEGQQMHRLGSRVLLHYITPISGIKALIPNYGLEYKSARTCLHYQ